MLPACSCVGQCPGCRNKTMPAPIAPGRFLTLVLAPLFIGLPVPGPADAPRLVGWDVRRAVPRIRLRAGRG